MKYTKKYLQDYMKLEEEKQFILKLIKYIVYTLISEYQDSELYVRMGILGIEGKRVYLDIVDKGLEFLDIVELSFVEYGDKRIDVELLLGQKVLEQELFVFKQKLLKVIQDWQLRLDVKNCMIDMSLSIESSGFAYFDILYTLAYRGLELDGLEIIGKPYYFVISYDKLTDRRTLYVDDDIIGDSVLVLYYGDLARFCNSLNSLFFNCYTKKLLLHVKIDVLEKEVLIGILEKLFNCDRIFLVYLDYLDYLGKGRLGLKTWFKVFKILCKLKRKGIRVYFNVDVIDV